MSDRSSIESFDACAGGLRDFRELQGTDLIARVEPFYRWKETRRRDGYWPDAKSMIDAFQSAGTSARALERTIAEFLAMEHAALYPTGRDAGHGVIKALVRPEDDVVMDALAHASLQEAASAATRNIHVHGHLDSDAVRRHLERIRSRDAVNGIMVVTESLFAMDSDTPDLASLQELCRAHGATLLVDVTNDLGCLGQDGRGQIGRQKMLGKIDLVIGSFAKSFGAEGGFVVSHSPAVREYLKFYGGSGAFLNGLSSAQCATVLKAFEIVKSAEGRARRETLMVRVGA